MTEYLTGENAWSLAQIKVTDEEQRGPYAQLRTEALVEREEEDKRFSMNFKLYNGEEGWRVYDLTLEDVSLIENYRSQFSSILANHSIEYLIEQLRKQANQNSKAGQSRQGK